MILNEFQFILMAARRVFGFASLFSFSATDQREKLISSIATPTAKKAGVTFGKCNGLKALPTADKSIVM